ncbi:sulfotransferase family 2 domain-containing protein [Amaricoccus sp.]|uniref:sulfotransferase family 2 domain-containing protein n=1 Tax=Amaricoccus sp. TaxID=1872485 RepID=UPI001B7C5B11|nr:sulfotransferase family 2 domain-containing protein [Amaricoccus sp.]MBP7000551.1 sulfotransferase family 2 domain-containing protein [Amaricoccus sp.]
MSIVSHRHRMIFLKTRKTAGSSLEIWLASRLDPETDLAALTADLRDHRPDLAAALKPRGLAPPATAAQVRALVGDAVWRSYFKFAVERNPWDRLISLWRWRQSHRHAPISLEAFLDAIAEGSPSRLKSANADGWSNWPIYSIDDQIAVDRVVLYEELETGLTEALAQVGIAYDGALPRAKSGARSKGDTIRLLSEGQRALIADLCRKEIGAFGFSLGEG